MHTLQVTSAQQFGGFHQLMAAQGLTVTGQQIDTRMEPILASIYFFAHQLHVQPCKSKSLVVK
jgi:hypothetical protein